MNCKFFATSLLFIFCQNLYAQKNYEPGFVIINKLDTLNGFIDYKNWSKNPERIDFKTVLEANPTSYGTQDISGFQVHGENYVKATVDRDASSARDEDLSYSNKAVTTKITVFLLVEFSGSKRLYYLKDVDNKEQIYIGNGPDDFELLDNYRYRIEDGNRSGIITSSRYKDQLKAFFQDCPSVEKSFPNLRYSVKDIQSLFNTYYSKCSFEKPETFYTHEKIITELGLFSGLVITKPNFKGYLYSGLGMDYSSSNNIIAGGFLNFVIPRTKKRLSIYNEIMYNAYSVHALDPGTYYKKDLNMRYSYLNLKNMFRYKIPTGKISIFLNIGISNGFAMKEKNFIGQTRKYEQGLLAGIGGTYKKFSFELRHENSDGMSVFQDFKSTINRNYAILAYRLK